MIICENERPTFEYPEIIKVSIRANKNYWLSVDVSKSRPFEKVRTLPRESLIPSIVAYICLAATAFEIISSRKVRTKRKKMKKGNSIDVLSNLKIKNNVELVQTCICAKYFEHNKRKTPLPDRAKRYIKSLGYHIKQNGLKNNAVFAISKKKTYIYMNKRDTQVLFQLQIFLFFLEALYLQFE